MTAPPPRGVKVRINADPGGLTEEGYPTGPSVEFCFWVDGQWAIVELDARIFLRSLADAPESYRQMMAHELEDALRRLLGVTPAAARLDEQNRIVAAVNEVLTEAHLIGTGVFSKIVDRIRLG